jgi:hypothetical protein
MRSVYFDQDYALGAGHFRENIADPLYRTSVPFGAVWKTPDRYARLVVGHPYWYVGFKPEPWESPSPQDMFSGLSPFQQVVHCKNAAILLFSIPEIDPHQHVRLRGGPRWAKPAPSDKPLQSCFAYYPKSVDEKVRTGAGFFLREGDVYIAIRPLRDGADWSDSAFADYERIDMPGDVTGCVVEMGSKPEFQSFAAFQTRVAALPIDTSALESRKRVAYTTTRGHRLEIQYAERGWLPKASVDERPLDFDQWPISESPYLTCRDRMLDINDGKQGLTIDWRGETPIYTYFEIVDGERRETGREFIGDDGALRREGKAGESK